MLKQTHIKTGLVVLILLTLSALSACTPSTKTIKQTKAERSQTELRSKPKSVPVTIWQEAYGEDQESGNNQLSDLVSDANITLKPPSNLWQRIRHGYGIDYPSIHPQTQEQIDWYASRPDYVNKVVERARPYLHHIVDELEQRNMPLEIALLPIIESGFQPFAYSSSRAAGLWQFIPSTGEAFGLEQNWWYDGRRDIIESTHAAMDYLQKLHKDFGDWQLALAAYNCGEGTVGRAIKRNKADGKATDFWSLDLPAEATAYVPKLLAVAQIVKQPKKFNITLSPIDNSPFLAVVDVGTQIDLALAARMAEITTDELYQLNPGFNRWATTPNGHHRLVLPLEKADIFQQALDALPPEERVQWTRHKIQSGESLSGIAHHYQTTLAVLKEANGLSSNSISAGSHLLIPIASAKPSAYPQSASQRLATRQNMQRKGHKKTYTVKAGDTWWDIAKTHNVGIKQLANWNGKAPKDTLHQGQKLVIWQQNNNAKTTNKTKTINYTIRSGDSLWKVSQKFNVSVAQVREWNGLSDRSLLYPGQSLTLYVDMTKQHSSI